MGDYPMNVSLEEALEYMMAGVRPVGTERVDIRDAWRRVLSEDIKAKENMPPFDRSPYDGYALRSEDTAGATGERPVTLSVIEEIPAGRAPKEPVGAGCAAKIMTGAPMPEGADAVIPFEQTVFDEGSVTVFAPVRAGTNVVRAGEDIAAGDTVLRKGLLLEAAEMAQASGLGCDRLEVYRQICAGILCSGSELTDVGEPLAPGKIRNSNGYMLAGYLRAAGAGVRDLGMADDDAAGIAKCLRTNIDRCDALITTGGASVGDYDVMREAIEMAGGSILFWRIRMKPGSAAVCGMLNGKPVFALSGNPGAAAVTLQLLVLPVLRRMMGLVAVYPQRLQVRMLGDFVKPSPIRRLLRGRLVIKNGEAYFAASEKQSNGMTSAMRGCTLLAEIPAGTREVREGTIIFAYDLEHFR